MTSIGGLNLFSSLVLTIGGTIRTICTILLLGYGISTIFSSETFETLLTKRTFWFMIIILAFYIVISVPIFGIHGDTCGYQHGHDYFKGLHYHSYSK